MNPWGIESAHSTPNSSVVRLGNRCGLLKVACTNSCNSWPAFNPKPRDNFSLEAAGKVVGPKVASMKDALHERNQREIVSTYGRDNARLRVDSSSTSRDIDRRRSDSIEHDTRK